MTPKFSGVTLHGTKLEKSKVTYFKFGPVSYANYYFVINQQPFAC